MKIAVYGTLKKGESNHILLGDSELLGTGRTLPGYYMLDLGHYPAIIPGNHRIKVEVYEVSESVLARLDRLEGHPSYYKRLEVPIELGEEEVLAEIYILQKKVDFPLITNYEPDGSISWRRK